MARILLAIALAAQWLQFPTPGVPRLPDGKPNLNAPAPRTPDGRPDLSGVWLPRQPYIRNLANARTPVIDAERMFNLAAIGLAGDGQTAFASPMLIPLAIAMGALLIVAPVAIYVVLSEK